MPFLPGDSLLFVVGADVRRWADEPAARDGAALGSRRRARQPEQLRDRPAWSGRACFPWETRAGSTERAFDQAHAFYERVRRRHDHRRRAFMPFLRTFAPFVAGVAQMTAQPLHPLRRQRRRALDRPVTLAGYLFGNIPWVKEQPRQDHLGRDPDPGLLVLIGAWRARMKQAKARPEPARRGRCRVGGRRARLRRHVQGALAAASGWRAHRAGLLLVDGAAAVDALKSCDAAKGGRTRQCEQAPTRRGSSPPRERAHSPGVGAAGNAAARRPSPGLHRRQRPRVLMSTTIGVTSFAVADGLSASTRPTQRRIHSAVSRT